MGRAWPQTAPNGKQLRRFQAKNPECSMVATRKPWDMPGLKLLQKYKYKSNIIKINVRINTDSFCFHLVSYLYLMTTAAFLTTILIDILEQFPNHLNCKFYKYQIMKEGRFY